MQYQEGLVSLQMIPWSCDAYKCVYFDKEHGSVEEFICSGRSQHVRIVQGSYLHFRCDSFKIHRTNVIGLLIWKNVRECKDGRYGFRRKKAVGFSVQRLQFRLFWTMKTSVKSGRIGDSVRSGFDPYIPPYEPNDSDFGPGSDGKLNSVQNRHR